MLINRKRKLFSAVVAINKKDKTERRVKIAWGFPFLRQQAADRERRIKRTNHNKESLPKKRNAIDISSLVNRDAKINIERLSYKEKGKSRVIL